MRALVLLLTLGLVASVFAETPAPAVPPAQANAKDATPQVDVHPNNVQGPGPNVPAAPAPTAPVAPVAPAAPAGPEAEWQKIDAKIVPIPQVRQYLTPGLLDPELHHVITFPKDGSLVDLELPHYGKDKAGNPYPAIKAAFREGGIWIDLNNNGIVDRGEVCVITPAEMYSEPFTCELHYDDGSSSQYFFRMKMIVDKEQYAIVSAVSHVAEYKAHKIVLIDDDGNGKFDDNERDAIIIDDKPVNILGKYVQLGEDYYEILVHTAGSVVEIRHAPKKDVGNVNVLDALKLLQKAENLKIETLIIRNADSFFAFDERHRSGKVPTGAYDLAFGVVERNKEIVYLKKGEKTSFNVMSGENNLPKWGGKITAQVEIDSDGEDVTIKKLQYTGEGSEHYFPENYNVSSPLCAIAMVYINPMTRVDQIVPFDGVRKLEKLPNGELKPLVLKCYRNKSEEYRVDITYDSGVMGPVTGRQKFQFEYHKKDPKDKEKDKDKAANKDKPSGN